MGATPLPAGAAARLETLPSTRFDGTDGAEAEFSLPAELDGSETPRSPEASSADDSGRALTCESTTESSLEITSGIANSTSGTLGDADVCEPLFEPKCGMGCAAGA